MIILKKLIICLFIFATLFAAASFAEDAAVTLCPFPVTVNGQEVNLKTVEYPFITYRDITYMPLTYDLCHFAGLKTHFAKYGYNENSPYRFYVGPSNEKTESYTPEKTTENGQKAYSAAVADYQIYACDETYDNKKADYPLLNFRGVTYLPLTWHFVSELFDWDYAFSGADGIVIDTRSSVRPELDCMPIWSTSPTMKTNCGYIWGNHFYVQYPGTTYGEVADFVYARRGKEEVRFNLVEELNNADILSLGSAASPGLWSEYERISVPPVFDGEKLFLICRTSTGHALLGVNMLEGKIIFTKTLE